MLRRAPEKQDRVVSGERAGCYDCDWKLAKPSYAKSSGGLSRACLWHTRTKGHRTWVQVTAVTDYVPCVTITNENGQNQEEDLPSDSGSSERDDVASVGGVRQDAEVLWRRLEREGTCVPTTEKHLDEANVRRTLAVSRSFVSALARHSSNQGKT
jgi:hypothetical protein